MTIFHELTLSVFSGFPIHSLRSSAPQQLTPRNDTFWRMAFVIDLTFTSAAVCLNWRSVCRVNNQNRQWVYKHRTNC